MPNRREKEDPIAFKHPATLAVPTDGCVVIFLQNWNAKRRGPLPFALLPQMLQTEGPLSL
jgi:hypothetical protein